ncbi:MAG: PAS domain S-box protein [Humidesulfovibrio sp.]
MSTADTPPSDGAMPAPGNAEATACSPPPTPGVHRRARQATLLCAAGAMAAGAFGLADALTGQRLLGGAFLPQYIPMAVSTAALFLFFGAALALADARQGRTGRPLLLGAVVVATLFCAKEGAEYVFGLPSSALEQQYDRLLAGLSATPTPMSPVTGALFLLAGSALGLLHFRVGQDAVTWRHDVAGYLGVAVGFVSLTLLGGYLHGSPFFYGTGVVPVALTTSLAFLLLGAGIVCAAGPGSLFLRAFFGDSTKARLMRIFPPCVAAMFLFHPVIEILVSKIFRGNPDLLFSLQVTALAAITAAITALAVRVVGVTLDQETAMRTQAEAKAVRESRTNKAHAEIAQALIRPGMTLQGLADILHRAATQLTGSRFAFVSTIDPATGDNIVHTLTAMFAHGQCALDRNIIFPRSPDGSYPALWGHALNTQEAFYTNAPASHLAARGLPAGHVPLEQFLSVPVRYEQQLVGQIGLANPCRGFTQEDLDMVLSLANLFALGVHRLRSEHMLLAAKDDLEKTVLLRTQALEQANAQLKREVAEREMFQGALKESAELFRAVVEDQTELICRFKPDGTILFVNNAYARYFDKRPGELTGQAIHAFLTPQAQEQVRSLVGGITAGDPVKTHEHTVLTPSGKVAWHAWTNRGIFDDQGRLQAIQAVGRDITQAKESEQALRELNERLEEKVRERTAQLEERAQSILRINADLQEQIATRLRAEGELLRRMETEALVADVSESLVNASAGQFAAALERSLGKLGRFLHFEHAAVFAYSAEARRFRLAHHWRAEGQEPLDPGRQGFGRRLTPLLLERLPAQEKLVIPDAALLPADAPGRPLLLEAGIRSLVAVPMTIRGRLRGALVLAGTREGLPPGFAAPSLLDNVALLLANAQERHGVDRSLRESERLARSIIESLAANICVVNRAGTLTMVNQAWERFARENAPAGAANLGIGANYVEVCRAAAAAGEPLAAEAAEGIAAVLAGKIPMFDLEYSCHSPQVQRWFIMQVVPFTGGGSGAVISHRDITARVLAAEDVRRSEERYRLIVETAQEGVLGVDAEARITYANPRMLSMLGYGFDELIGRRLPEIIAPEDQEMLREKQRQRRQGLADQYELRYTGKDGAPIWTMTSVAPVMGPDGRYAGTIGMSLDISDRVRAEQLVRKNEARYRSLVEALQEGLLMLKADGTVAYLNEPFARMLGRPETEILGRPAGNFAAPKSKAALAAMLARSGTDSGAMEVVWEHSSGRHIYSLFSLSASQDGDGGGTGYFAIVTDTTERKGLESQLLQSQKLEAIGQLAAGIAHEINTPAQYVGNNVQFIKTAFADIISMCGEFHQLLETAKSGAVPLEQVLAVEKSLADHDIEYLTAEVPGAIAQTLEGVERISTIVRSVKQFAHPGAAVMAPADLNEAMRSTVTVSRNEWKYVAELQTQLDESLPLVICMVGELNQVVLNLIINAAHAIADALKADPQRGGLITLTTRLAPPWAEIRVADNGLGIPPAVQDKIFDPFFTTKEVGKGTGQGLTISRAIVVDKHKGQLFFETKPGAGTTFVVRLPLEQSEEREP